MSIVESACQSKVVKDFSFSVSDVVSLKERGKYQGITGCVVALANSCGPIVGGAFTENASWRWCFVSLVIKSFDLADISPSI